MAKRGPEKFLPKEIRLVYDDPFLYVVDKAAGLLAVPAKYEKEQNVLQIMTQFFRKGNSRSTKELFAVNRLDRETSGLMLLAKDLRFREELHVRWQETTKEYIAVVQGVLPQDEGLIESYLYEDETYFVRSTANPDKGKYAATRYRVLKRSTHWTTVLVQLLTGRKNQIRVHFAEAGFPLLGDVMYGKAAERGGRLALHAYHVNLVHPRKKQEPILDLYSSPSAFFNSYLPKDFEHKKNSQ